MKESLIQVSRINTDQIYLKTRKRNLDNRNKSCIMIITEPTTPLIFHAQPGGTFAFMGCFMYQYPKQILTIAQQVQSCIDAGMVITSRADVEKAVNYSVIELPSGSLIKQNNPLFGSTFFHVYESLICRTPKF